MIGLSGGFCRPCRRPLVAAKTHTLAFACALGVSACDGPFDIGPGAEPTDVPLSEQTPVAMALPLNSIAAGGGHTCALGAAGGVYCWGRNGGALGAVEGRSASVPVRLDTEIRFQRISGGVDGRFPDQGGIDAESRRGCGLTDAGKAYCWGSSSDWAVGSGIAPECSPDGGCENVSTGVFEVAGAPPLRRLGTGYRDTCGVESSGVLLCWGALIDSPRPAAFPGMTGDVLDVAVGWVAACALDGGGGIWCWGDNRFAQISPSRGIGDLHPLPEAVESTAAFETIVVGGGHACALTTKGEVHCWGRNDEGQLGDGAVDPTCPDADVSANRVTCPEDRFGPRAVPGGLRFRRVVAGMLHTCGLTLDGDVYCWGRGDEGQLGNGSRADRPVPSGVAGERGFVDLTAGNYHTCAISTDGAAFCWGWGRFGQTGQRDTEDRLVPTRVVGQGS